MADFKHTIKFIATFFWVVGKQQFLIIALSWILYFIRFGEDINLLLKASVFIITLILLYGLSTKDNYLNTCNFYKFFEISPGNRLVSKILIFGGLMTISLTLLLLFNR